MPSFARELEQTLHNALGEASRRRHEYATLEHLLIALVDDEHASKVMTACGVSRDDLRSSVKAYLDNELGALVADNGTDPTPTSGFQRVVQRAILHVQSSGRDEVTGANVLVALFSERESYAVYFLQQQDMSRLDAVTYISHGVGKGDTPAEPRDVSAAEEKSEQVGGQEGKRPQAVHRRPQREGPPGQGRSADRPHARGRPHRADPLPPLEEQPALRRRSRRRQDRHRRRPGAQDRRGRRPRSAAARRDLRARHGRVARRHALSRRFRGAAEVGRQRAREAPARDPVHRRNPHRDRRRRDQRRGDGRVEPAQARAVIGHDPLHRFDHLQGIPQPFRKGPRAAAPVPEDRRQRADDRGHDQDHRRPALVVRGATTTSATRPTRSRAAVELSRPLHPRPQAARQGDRRDRRGRRDADAGAAVAPQEDHHHQGNRGGRRDHRAHPAQVGLGRRQARARASRNRSRSASSSARTWRSRNSPRRSSCRAPACASPTSRSAIICSPARPASARPRSRASWRRSWAFRCSASTCPNIWSATRSAG